MQLAFNRLLLHVACLFRPASTASCLALQMGPTWLTAPAYLQRQALKSLRRLGLADDILAAALAEHTSTASRSAFLLIWYPSKGGKDTQFCSWPNETWSQLSGSYC